MLINMNNFYVKTLIYNLNLRKEYLNSILNMILTKQTKKVISVITIQPKFKKRNHFGNGVLRNIICEKRLNLYTSRNINSILPLGISNLIYIFLNKIYFPHRRIQFAEISIFGNGDENNISL